MISKKQLEGCIPTTQMNLIFESRIIWRDLATWIQAYLVSVFAGFGNQDSVEEKINRVITKFGYIISTIFGSEVADQYVKLISNYISIFKFLVEAQINGDITAVNEYTEQLYENANQIAAFLSDINPFWTENEWKTLLYRLNEMIIEESTSFLNKEYTKSIEIFDRILNLTSVIGNYYSKGLINYLTYSG